MTVTGFNKKTSVQAIHVSFDLVITTLPLENTNNISTPYDVTCEVYHISDLQSGFPSLEYSIDGGANWQSIEMTFVTENA